MRLLRYDCKFITNNFPIGNKKLRKINPLSPRETLAHTLNQFTHVKVKLQITNAHTKI